MKFLAKQTGDILTILIEEINNFNFKLNPAHNSTFANMVGLVVVDTFCTIKHDCKMKVPASKSATSLS